MLLHLVHDSHHWNLSLDDKMRWIVHFALLESFEARKCVSVHPWRLGHVVKEATGRADRHGCVERERGGGNIVDGTTRGEIRRVLSIVGARN